MLLFELAHAGVHEVLDAQKLGLLLSEAGVEVALQGNETTIVAAALVS